MYQNIQANFSAKIKSVGSQKLRENLTKSNIPHLPASLTLQLNIERRKTFYKCNHIFVCNTTDGRWETQLNVRVMFSLKEPAEFIFMQRESRI